MDNGIVEVLQRDTSFNLVIEEVFQDYINLLETAEELEVSYM